MPDPSAHLQSLLVDLRTELGLRHEQAVSLLPVSGKEYREHSSGWLAKAHREGRTMSTDDARMTRRDAQAFVERVSKLLRDAS
jgi:hypothetical protein